MHVHSTEKNVYDLIWNDDGIDYRHKLVEKEFSAYNFEYANTENLLKFLICLKMKQDH